MKIISSIIILFLTIMGIAITWNSIAYNKPKTTSNIKEKIPPKIKLKLNEYTELEKKLKRYSKINALLMPGFNTDSQLFSTTATITSYNPLKEQCDKTPLTNSSEQLVMPGQIALPQQMRKRLGIKLHQHMIIGEWGVFEVTDHMNPRYNNENRVDIISFIPKWSKKFGVHKNIKIYWWD